MPNWKKVIVSGSDAVLNSLNVTTALTASGLNYPTVDGTANQVIQTDGLGNLSFGSVDTTYEVVKNVAGTTLYKGTPVHATASNALGNVIGIIAASASNPSTMPATFILNEDLADEAEGYAIISGLIQGVDTSAFEEGDIVYVGENSGYTNVKPTGSNLIQNLGIVTKIHPSNGAGIVLGAGRSNDVPNLLSGEVFWGENNRSIQKPLAHILSGSSYTYSGSFSGSFQGDGSGLTGLLTYRSQAVTGSFISVTSTTITHNLSTENILVSVYDNTKNYIIPDSIQILNENNVQIGFTSPTTGYAVVTSGGHILSGSVEWTNILNKPSGIVSSSAQISITESQISDLTHYTDSDVLDYLTTGVGGTIIPSTTDIYDLGSPTKRWGDVYLTSASIYLNNAKISATSNGFISGSFTGSFLGDGSQLSGVTSYTDADTLSYINTLGVVSSSAQLSTEISGAFNSVSASIATDIANISTDFVDITNKPTLVSSSLQIDYNSIQNQPTIPTNNNQLTNGAGYTTYSDSDTLSYINTIGVVSGSSQITLSSATGNLTAARISDFDTEVSNNTSVTANTAKVGYTDALVKSKLNTESVLSGSITSAKITDVDAFSQSGTYANLRAQGTTASDVGLGNVTNESKATMFTNAALTGNPTAPTQTGTDDSTKIATTAFVQDRIDTVIGTAGSALDTLGELSASLSNDQDALAALTTTVGTKLAKSSNLSDLTNVATARTNLGLGTAATTNSTAYATAAQGTNADTAYSWGDHALAGYTSCTGDITGVTAGTSLTGGGTSGTVTINHADTSTLTGAQGSAGIASITVDGLGHVTAVTTATYCTTDTNTTYTANDMLTCIKTVDGAGSGLDADTLDGNQASAFYLATNPSGYTTCTGDITGVTAGTGLSGGGTSGTVTVSHADTSTLTGAQGSAGIASITVDALGHVTAVTTATYCTTDTNTTYTANEMLTCIKTVDGAGSGLDADTLDGNQASAFYSATNPNGYTSCTGTLTGTGTSGYIPKWNGSTSQTNSVIYDNGTNVGIGTTSPSEKLSIVGKIALNDGGNSVFVGDGAGSSDDASNNRNVGIGYQAMYNNTTGALNVANGCHALFSNTTGYENTANGADALYSNTTGNFNTANGADALYSNTTGYENTANGADALYSNTTGGSNVANGYAALFNNTTGGSNVANGHFALFSNTTGCNNTANGYVALYANTTGNNNVANGCFAGTFLSNGTLLSTANGSMFLGANTKASANSNTNEIVIGTDAIGNGSNSVTIGNTSIVTTVIGGNVLPQSNATQNLGSSTLRWNTVYTSDLSLKNDIGDWTIVEGEEDLFLYNNKKDKVYKFNLTEVDKYSAPKKRS